jgi:hypothetical protein
VLNTIITGTATAIVITANTATAVSNPLCPKTQTVLPITFGYVINNVTGMLAK